MKHGLSQRELDALQPPVAFKKVNRRNASIGSLGHNFVTNFQDTRNNVLRTENKRQNGNNAYHSEQDLMMQIKSNTRADTNQTRSAQVL